MKLKKSLVRKYIALYKIFGYKIVHFIHIGKTAGTAIKSAVKAHRFITGSALKSGKCIFLMEQHGFKLSDVPDDEYVFFVVRDPLKRFISGFYSRLRMGKPRIYNPWSEEESIAFGHFKTPNELGEALSSTDEQLRLNAVFALNNIKHVNSSYWDWMVSPEILNKRRRNILFFLNQETLQEDLDNAGEKWGFSFGKLPDDEVLTHKNPEHFDKKLSELAVNNLKQWFSREYEFLQMLKE